jgi:hypothetical protein
MDITDKEPTGVKDLNFFPYEINKVIFPGMGIKYLDEKGLGGYPLVVFPEGRVEIRLQNMLTAYAIDYYMSDQNCLHYDQGILSKALVRTRDFFFNLVALGFAKELDNHWSME